MNCQMKAMVKFKVEDCKKKKLNENLHCIFNENGSVLKYTIFMKFNSNFLTWNYSVDENLKKNKFQFRKYLFYHI